MYSEWMFTSTHSRQKEDIQQQHHNLRHSNFGCMYTAEGAYEDKSVDCPTLN